MSRIALRLPTPVDVVRGAFAPVEWTLDTARLALSVPARVFGLIEAAEELVHRADLLLAAAAEVIAHVEETVRGADDVIDSVDDTVASADAVVARVDRTVSGADAVIARVGRTVSGADLVVTRVGGVVDGAEGLIARGEPMIGFVEAVVTRVRPAVEAVLLEQGLDAGRAREVATRVGEVAAYFDQVLVRMQPSITRVVDSIDPDEVTALVELIDRLPDVTRSLEKDILPVLATMDNVAPEVHQILTVAQDCLEALAGIPGFSLLRKRGEDKIEELT